MVTGNEMGISVVNRSIALSVVKKSTASVENICSGESVVPKSRIISAVVGGKSAAVGVVSNIISNGTVVSKSSGGSGVVRGGNSSAWRLTTAAFKLAAKQMASFMFFVFACALQVSCALICVFLSLNTVSLCAIGLYSELVRRNEILKNGFVSVLEVNSLSLFLP